MLLRQMLLQCTSFVVNYTGHLQLCCATCKDLLAASQAYVERICALDSILE